MHTRKFVWEEKEQERGWKPVDAPDFGPGGPTVVAHDTLEHFTSSENFKDELLAFCAIIYGRAFREESDYEQHALPHDLGRFLIEQDFNVPKSKKPNRSLPARQEKMLERMKEEVLLGYEATNVLSAIFHRDGMDIERATKALDRCLPWIRRGYRLAERLNRGHTRAEFKQYVDRLRIAIFEDHDKNPPEEGDTLTIHADKKNLEFQLIRE